MTTDPRQLVEQVLVVIGAMTGTPLEIHGTDADLEEAARVALLSSLTPRLVEALVEALDERDELRLTLAAEQGRTEGAPSYVGMDWMDDVKVWRSALLRLVGGRTDHLAAMFGEEIARAAVAWGNGDSARWDNLSAPEQAHWVADHIERAAMLAAGATTAPCAGPAPASTASPPTGT